MVPEEPLGNKAPENWRLPTTSRGWVGAVVPMPTLPANLLFPAPVWVINPDERVTLPEVKVRFLPEAMVVSPLMETAPVPVPKVPEPAWVKLLLAETVNVPLEVRPEVAVMRPEMVGVAVQAVPVTVRFPPREVRLVPETVKVLSKVVAPWRVRAPGVVDEPMVLIDEAPEPKVLVREVPVPRVVAPEEVRVVKAPVLGVVEPIVPGATQVAPTKLLALMVPVPE